VGGQVPIREGCNPNLTVLTAYDYFFAVDYVSDAERAWIHLSENLFERLLSGSPRQFCFELSDPAARLHQQSPIFLTRVVRVVVLAEQALSTPFAEPAATPSRFVWQRCDPLTHDVSIYVNSLAPRGGGQQLIDLFVARICHPSDSSAMSRGSIGGIGCGIAECPHLHRRPSHESIPPLRQPHTLQNG
jgi:hypothetical protein